MDHLAPGKTPDAVWVLECAETQLWQLPTSHPSFKPIEKPRSKTKPFLHKAQVQTKVVLPRAIHAAL
jgi:hypothetical protein